MRVAWTRPALRHIEEIQDYIAQDSPRAANKVANTLIDRTNACSQKQLWPGEWAERAGPGNSYSQISLTSSFTG